MGVCERMWSWGSCVGGAHSDGFEDQPIVSLRDSR
jgi:hypothetical protein